MPATRAKSVINSHRNRLQLAEKIGVIAIADTGVAQIVEPTGGKGAAAAANASVTRAAT